MTIPKLASIISDLPAGFLARPCEPTDVAACTELVRAVDIAACGETSTTEEELAGDMFAPEVKRDEASIVITNDDQVVAMLTCFNSLSEGRDLFFDFFIHPAIEESIANQIAVAAVKAAEEFTFLHMIENNLESTKCKTALYEADKAFIHALNERGFEFHRTFWRMSRDVTDFQNVQLPDGYSLVDFTDSEDEWRELHAVQTAAFMDYYDFQPLGYDYWHEMMTGSVNDPKLWRVVKFNNNIVGYLMGSHRFTSEKFGYVASIGVVREHRSQGIARALLADAFNRDKETGMKATLLHGDSSNPTGAMKLYESVGMINDRVYVAFRKEITKR